MTIEKKIDTTTPTNAILLDLLAPLVFDEEDFFD